MVKKPVQKATEEVIRRDYPLEGKTPGWFFRCKETSNGVYLVEGTDLWGRSVGCSGTNPEQLLLQCDSSAQKIYDSVMSEESEKAPEPPNSPSPEPKRRWYQYSLRSLMVVITLLCIWLGYISNEARKQRNAVAWVEKVGGQVGYDCLYYGNSATFLGDDEPPGPDWLRNLIGIDYYCSVEVVVFMPKSNGTVFFDNVTELTPLKGLPSLEAIIFYLAVPSHQELRKLQAELPNCVFIRGYFEDEPQRHWCKQCNDWHREDSDPHTAPN